MDPGQPSITPDMVAELEAHVDDIISAVAIQGESWVRRRDEPCLPYGRQCPKAAGISGCHQFAITRSS